MPRKMEKFLQIAPHSLAIVLGPAEGPAGERSEALPPAAPAQPRQLARHHIGYEIFADFKAENMQHFWNKKVTAAVAETFFLGWIDEQVLLIQGKEEHLEALREGWSRRALRPPSGFHIRYLGESGRARPVPSRPVASSRGSPPRPARAGAQALLPRAPAPPSTLAPRRGRGRGLGERGIGELPGNYTLACVFASTPPPAGLRQPLCCTGGAVPGAGQVGGGAEGSAGQRWLGVCGSHLLRAAPFGGACADAGEVEKERSGGFR